MQRRGFTLLELLISMGILSAVSVLGMVAVRTSASMLATTAAMEVVQSNVRDPLRIMRAELQLAAKRANPALLPALQTVQITANPVAGSPVEISFQTPTDLSAVQWSRLIRYRFMYEDANNNNRLDAGEDTDRDGLLTRRILRIQDRNGDGDTNDAGDVAPIGGSNDIRNVTFVRNGDLVTITLTANRLVGTNRTRPISATETARVYLLN